MGGSISSTSRAGQQTVASGGRITRTARFCTVLLTRSPVSCQSVSSVQLGDVSADILT